MKYMCRFLFFCEYWDYLTYFFIAFSHIHLLPGFLTTYVFIFHSKLSIVNAMFINKYLIMKFHIMLDALGVIVSNKFCYRFIRNAFGHTSFFIRPVGRSVELSACLSLWRWSSGSTLSAWNSDSVCRLQLIYCYMFVIP